MENIFEKLISKHIFEIRYTASGKLLDIKGQIADTVKFSNAIFNHWSITNRVDFSSEDNKFIKAFLGHKSFGLASESPNDIDFFVVHSKEYIKSLWNIIDQQNFIRFGVRSMYLIETDNFKDTLESLNDSFLKLDPRSYIFNSELIDLGIVLDFQNENNYFKLNTGPMEKAQSKSIFEMDKLPESAIFIDIDYYTKSLDNKSQRKILEYIDEGINKAKDLTDLVIKNIKIKNK